MRFRKCLYCGGGREGLLVTLLAMFSACPTLMHVVHSFLTLCVASDAVSASFLTSLCRFVFDGINEDALNSALDRAIRYYKESECIHLFPCGSMSFVLPSVL